MRRRTLITGLACLCALALAACGLASGRESPEGLPCELYFRGADLTASAGGDVFQTETVYIDETLDTQAQAEALLEALLAGPSGEFRRSLIPAGTSLLSVEVDGGRALVDFSAGYSTLSGIRLTMADYAVALTLTQLPDVAVVRVTVQGQDLAYRDSQLFSARDVLLSSEEDVVGTVEAELWFLDQEGRLAAERRTLDLYEGDTQVMAVARALEQGPENRELSPSLPENFRLKSVWLEEDMCYVNFPSAQMYLLGTGEPLEASLRAIRQSLCSLEAVEEVRFLLDGEYLDAESLQR